MQIDNNSKFGAPQPLARGQIALIFEQTKIDWLATPADFCVKDGAIFYQFTFTTSKYKVSIVK